MSDDRRTQRFLEPLLLLLSLLSSELLHLALGFRAAHILHYPRVCFLSPTPLLLEQRLTSKISLIIRFGLTVLLFVAAVRRMRFGDAQTPDGGSLSYQSPRSHS